MGAVAPKPKKDGYGTFLRNVGVQPTNIHDVKTQ